MTTPRYASRGCAAGSQESGDASSPVYAWGVNLNNGNANINNRNNDGLALPVSPLAAPASEYQSAERVTLKELYDAWQSARRGKKPSRDQARFEADWFESLIKLEESANDGSLRPSPTTCFVAKQPKAREIHAPAFCDRVLHHYLVPRLEAWYERIFLDCSYANRKGKGTHAAVAKAQGYVRQVQSGQGLGWFLQLDVRNFFNSIHRPTLWAMVKRVMVRSGMPKLLQRLVHALLRQSPLEQGVRHRSTPAERASVPMEKRLENAPRDRGLAIGNLSSQFFANVYLHALDCFVKHVLKVKRYVRFADDFVIVHHCREQLEQWRQRIEDFLRDTLHLELKAEQKLAPLVSGIDFLGYVIFPTHTRVRARVVTHAKEKLHAWQQRHFAGETITASPAQLRQLVSIWGSYKGHLQHANSYRLQQSLYKRFPWLQTAAEVIRKFPLALDERQLSIPVLGATT